MSYTNGECRLCLCHNCKRPECPILPASCTPGEACLKPVLACAEYDGKERFFRAMGKNNSPIITVLASSMKDAFQKVKEQLDRPGRDHFYQAWIDNGKVLNFKIRCNYSPKGE